MIQHYLPVMKKSILHKSILFAALASATFLTSCTDQNPGTPNIDDRDRFAGTWICKETIGSGSSASVTTFTVDVTKHGVSDTIYLKNFSNYGSSAVAQGEVTGNSMTIPSQYIGITSILVGGSGVYSGSTNANEKINMVYQTDGQSATALYTRN